MEWTGKTTASTVYDSTVDPFTADGLFEKVRGKPNIAVVAYTAEGDVFGGFHSVAVDNQDDSFHDPSIFLFSFESRGRCETPQRFVVKEEVRDRVSVCYNKNHWKLCFIVFGADLNGGVQLGNAQSPTMCWKLAKVFEGIDDTTVTGADGVSQPHHCTRLVALQLS